MPDEFKNKFHAKAEEEKTKRENTEMATRKYNETAMREYPRLMNGLFDRVTAVFSGVSEVKITGKKVSVPISYTEGSTATGIREKTIGNVDAQEFDVAFAGKRLTFRSGGTNFIGFHGKIEVTASGNNNPFAQGIWMVASKENSEQWKLAVRNEERASPSISELTDDVLKQRLEDFFL